MLPLTTKERTDVIIDKGELHYLCLNISPSKIDGGFLSWYQGTQI